MKINANNAIAVVNNVSKNQITVYPVKIHFICRKKHVNYVMKLVKNVQENPMIIVKSVKRIWFFIMDNVCNNVPKKLLIRMVYVVMKIAILVAKNKINKNVLNVKNIFF